MYQLYCADVLSKIVNFAFATTIHLKNLQSGFKPNAVAILDVDYIANAV